MFTRRAYLPAALVAGAIALCLAVAVWAQVSTAIYVFAGFLLVLAVLRVVLPWRPWLGGRSATTDAIVLVVLAIALIYLAPWGDVALLGD